MRESGQIDKARVDTKELIRTILTYYSKERTKYRDVTETLVENVRKAYYKFIKAHQGVHLMKMYGINIITDLIIKRYFRIIKFVRKGLMS